MSSSTTPIASSSSSHAHPPATPPPRAQLLPSSSPTSLSTASSLLHAHLPVAFPTETVYGLGASALSSIAVKRIFEAKGRPSDNPLIVHVGGREMLESLLPRLPEAEEGADKKGKGRAVGPINPMYEALMQRFWPGPLSLVFSLSTTPSSSSDASPLVPPRLTVAPEVTASLPSLCVRMPSHPLALSLIRHSNLPLAAPSANLSSRPSPTSAQHVMADLGEGRGVGAVLEGGECDVGVESTVVDYVPPAEGESGEGRLRVLRAGGVSAEAIESCLRDAGFGASTSDGGGSIQVYSRDFKSTELEAKPTTPGMKYKHYAPGNSKVVLVRPNGKKGENEVMPSLQDLVQLAALTQGGEDGGTFRVGLMLTTETLASVGSTPRPSPPATAASDSAAPATPCERITLPPPPPSLFAQLAAGEESNLPPLSAIEVYAYPLGERSKPEQAAKRLFGGLRWLDALPRAGEVAVGEEKPGEKQKGKEGVDLILVEAVPEEGVGLAVMERARKAAGGGTGGEMEFRI
ncbi:hypothetical protein JCM21900_004372 [Sporobolomyces salmonicolor]